MAVSARSVSWEVDDDRVAFVLRGRMDRHRRLGSKAAYIAVLMLLLGLAAGLTSAAQGLKATTPGLTGHEPPVAADPGFARSMEYLSPPLTSPRPAWNALATGIIHAWGYTGGMP